MASDTVSEKGAGVLAASAARPSERPTLPVLLIPGFMSTGLEVEESSICPHWKDERVWLHLPKLGFQAMHMKGLWRDEEGQLLKNKWLDHLMLRSPTEEVEGVRLRPVEGLDGVDFLDPDSLFGLAAESTYVFAPVISALEGMGYTRGEDLDAASYDFRLAPRALGERDERRGRRGYFDRLKDRIEQMDRSKTGVVLVAHSMGNKVATYFFEYARKHWGQEWLDTHVHLYVAAGAPLLGAPAAARATLLGDRMGLDAFLTMPEATLMARSFSSSPWLFPTGAQASKAFYLRRQGLLEIRDLFGHLPHLGMESSRNAVVLTVEVDWGRGLATESLTTKSSVDFDASGGDATFDPASNLLLFGSPASIRREATVQVIVKEKGFSDDHDANPLKRLTKATVAVGQLMNEAFHGRRGQGVPKASTTLLGLEDILKSQPDDEGFRQVRLPLAKLHALGPQTRASGADWLSGYVTLRARWRDPQRLRQDWLGSAGFSPPPRGGARAQEGFSLRHPRVPEAEYDVVSLLDLLQMEGSTTLAGVPCPDVMKVWREYYEQDDVYNHKGADDRPPIRSMLSIHGVNLPTEVGYALCVHTVRAKPSMFHTRFVLDEEAELVKPPKGLEISGGIISETLGGDAPSGDGTVPRRSLEHSKDWQDQLRLSTVRLEAVAHRDMLASPQFHEALHDVLYPMGGFLDRWQSSTNGHEWFDFPPHASSQLESARIAGKSSVDVTISKYVYRIDLKALVQKNRSTGRERRVRRLLAAAGELAAASEVTYTSYRGWPDSGFHRSEVICDNASETDACAAARRAVREDPENCVVELVFYMSWKGGHWCAKAFWAGSEQTMTFTQGPGRGYMVYSNGARSKPPPSH